MGVRCAANDLDRRDAGALEPSLVERNGRTFLLVPLPDVPVPLPAAESVRTGSSVEWARSLLACRLRRDRHLPGVDLGEASWNMLLDLYVARAEGRPVSVSGACAIAGVPPTTALRHQAALSASGYVVRKRDEFDGRRIHLQLTEVGAARIEAALIDDVSRLPRQSSI